MTLIQRRTQRVNPDFSDVQVSSAVRASTWEDTANLHNYILGCGISAIPAYTLNKVLQSGNDHDFYFRVRDRDTTVHRRWKFVIKGTTTSVRVQIKVPNTGTAQEFSVGTDPSAYYVDEHLSAVADTEKPLSCNIKPTNGNATIVSIEARSMPSSVLQTTTSYVLPDHYFRPGSPIIGEGVFTNLTLAHSVSHRVGRRCSMVQWSIPDTVNGATSTQFAVSTTSTTTPADIWQLGVPVLGRYLTTSTANAVCRFRVWKSAAGANGSVWMHGTSMGSTALQTISSTTPIWVPATTTSALALTFNAEDLTQSNGLPSAVTWDVLTPRIRAGAGATVYCTAVSVFSEE